MTLSEQQLAEAVEAMARALYAALAEGGNYINDHNDHGDLSFVTIDAISNLHEVAQAALTAALPIIQPQWLPIETAPRDGTEIVLLGPYPENGEGKPTNRVTAGFWCAPGPPVVGDCGGPCRCPEYGEPIEAYWASMHGGSDDGWMSTDGGFTTEWPPTHWMPLPAPPALADEVKG